ncbi:hypothetical protein NC651_012150 [Populus alba x Populus x berolinensis]|nr:hypothetical protein NC651_012150 [Populus alba x Populus x berolinensis]
MDGDVAGDQINVFLDGSSLVKKVKLCSRTNFTIFCRMEIIFKDTVLKKSSAALKDIHRKKFPKFDGGSLQEFAEELKREIQEFFVQSYGLSVVLQQSDGLNFQDMEFLHSQEGFKIWDAGAIACFPLHEDMGKELRHELENFKNCIPAKFIVRKFVAQNRCQTLISTLIVAGQPIGATLTKYRSLTFKEKLGRQRFSMEKVEKVRLVFVIAWPPYLPGAKVQWIFIAKSAESSQEGLGKVCTQHFRILQKHGSVLPSLYEECLVVGVRGIGPCGLPERAEKSRNLTKTGDYWHIALIWGCIEDGFYHALENSPQPGPATLCCLVPLWSCRYLDYICEGFSLLIILLFLHLRRTPQKGKSYQAARCRRSSLCQLNVQRWIISLTRPKTLVEDYIFKLIDSQFIYDSSQSGKSFLVKMMQNKQSRSSWKTRGQHLWGHQCYVLLFQESWQKKALWDLAEAKTHGDKQLFEYLVYLAMEAGLLARKFDELFRRTRYSLKGSVLQRQILHLDELAIEILFGLMIVDENTGNWFEQDKTKHNWELRPLSHNQLEYAALDAAVLVHIFHHFHNHSQSAGFPDGHDKIEWKSHIVSRMDNPKKAKKESKNKRELEDDIKKHGQSTISAWNISS